MRTSVFAALLLALPATAFAADDCQSAANKALESTMAATTTLAVATKYMTAHDDWCEGGTFEALEQQDGAAVDRAWAQAITAQSLCAQDASFRDQMAKLAVTLHSRRLKINDHLATLRARCN